MPIFELAMPVPLRRTFDYLAPPQLTPEQLAGLRPGSRVLAPFGRRKLVGILVAIKAHSELADELLKPALEVLDGEASLEPDMLALAQWAAGYYQHPIGEALLGALPVALRKGESIPALTETRWQLTPEGKGLPEGALRRARQQARLLALLQATAPISRPQLREAGLGTATLKALIEKGLVEEVEVDCAELTPPSAQPALALNAEQRHAVDSVTASGGFHCFLLEGITGSGKTEVYLQVIQHCLGRGEQALILIPEIGLTPQTLARFQRRFACTIVTLHSGMTDRERLQAWQLARSGRAGVVIGTRSAVFTALARPGVIIVDEEHDSSFKQQDGFRYSARDVAIKRAALADIPILLGSATPSLESLYNVEHGRYTPLPLTRRATGALAPSIELLDIRHAPLADGFSPVLLEAIAATLARGEQVLVFINRRGFAPALLCHDCGFVAACAHCDARMTVHYQQRQLRCHHCEYQQPLPAHCPDCGSAQLDFRGVGTERSQQALQRRFADVQCLRIDRDTTANRYAMENLLEQVNRGEPAILIGTQMLAKGHHFADVTLVAVLDIDGGLFSADFRAPEKMGQLLTQVAGRAGREQKPGKVIVQTHQPDHPLLSELVEHGYPRFARSLLKEREMRQLPPWSHLALVRAEAGSLEVPEQFLQALKPLMAEHPHVRCLGPLPAPMTRRAGRYRVQLLLQSSRRSDLHRAVASLHSAAEDMPLSKKVRWHIDIDPLDAF